MAQIDIGQGELVPITEFLDHVNTLAGEITVFDQGAIGGTGVFRISTELPNIIGNIEELTFTFTVTDLVFGPGPGFYPVSGAITEIYLESNFAGFGAVWTMHDPAISVEQLLAARESALAGDEGAVVRLFMGLGLGFTGTSLADTLLTDQMYDSTNLNLTGNDTVSLGAGNDVYALSDGRDSVLGEDGADTLYGEAGADTLVGGIGADVLYGGTQADVLQGEQHADLLDGGNGNDNLAGGRDRDTLRGGGGNDSLDGGLGNDSLNPGAGIDVISFLGEAGNDTVKGFDPLTDLLRIQTTVVTFDTVAAGVLIAWSSGSVLVRDVTLPDLDVGTNIDLF